MLSGMWLEPQWKKWLDDTIEEAIMRCHIRITTGLRETYCYEPLDIDGKCRYHGQQAYRKPEWMGEDQWKKWLDKTSVSIGPTPATKETV